MKPQHDLPCLLLVLSALLLAPVPGMAQEESEAGTEEPEQGDLMVEFGTWVAQPAGLEFRSAARTDPTTPLSTRLIEPAYSTETELAYRAWYRMPAGVGKLGFDYYAHESMADLDRLEPGNFVYGELLGISGFAGFDNDGQADGVQAETSTRLRDWRLTLRRPAFRGARSSGEWFVGWRRVDHKFFQDVAYHALAPSLPPSLIPPLDQDEGQFESRPDLIPEADIASTSSVFEGRGPTLGLDIDFPLWRDKLLFEGGASIGILRGNINSTYSARNSLYLLRPGGIGPMVLEPFTDENGILLAPYGPAFSAFVDSSFQPCDPGLGEACDALIEDIRQTVARVGIDTGGQSASSEVFEGRLGLRWRAMNRLEVFLGFRAQRYNNIGVSVRPGSVESFELRLLPTDTIESFVINVQGIEETPRSVTYEGFYAGVTAFLF